MIKGGWFILGFMVSLILDGEGKLTTTIKRSLGDETVNWITIAWFKLCFLLEIMWAWITD